MTTSGTTAREVTRIRELDCPNCQRELEKFIYEDHPDDFEYYCIKCKSSWKAGKLGLELQIAVGKICLVCKEPRVPMMRLLPLRRDEPTFICQICGRCYADKQGQLVYFDD